MEDLELLAAAYHEAGHIVVAYAQDGRVDGLELYWSDLGRWFGNSPVRLCKDDPQGIELLIRIPQLSAVGARTAVAGMLAQAKHKGARKFGEHIEFDKNADLGAVAAFLRDNRRTEETPGAVTFAFVCGGGSIETLELNGHCFSTADSKSFNTYVANGSLDPMDLTREAMHLIDDPINWKRVGLLVSLVLSEPAVGDTKRGFLTPEHLLRALTV